MPLPYKSVVFDYGGVLINPITGPIATVAEELGVAPADLVHVLLGPMMESTPDHPWHRAERGEIPVADMQSLAALKASFVQMGQMVGFDAVATDAHPDVETVEHVHHDDGRDNGASRSLPV